MEAERLGVRVVTECHISRAACAGKGRFQIESDQGVFQGERLILAAGSKAGSCDRI